MARAPLDLVIVGAGIGGIVSLHYARQAGLQAVVLERAGRIGGLWARLPAWQDIQIGLQDWALGDVAPAGATQPHILASVQAWVDRFGLADGIRLNTPVLKASRVGGLWEVQTSDGVVPARHLLAATGAHNVPFIPAVNRQAAKLRELHSCALRDPGELTGRRVLVVGGGASAFDLLDLAFEHGAAEVAWAFRDVRWFMPTTKSKQVAGSIRGFAKMQMSGMSTDQQNDLLRADLQARYAKFGLQDVQPERPLDLRRDQLVSGRPRMLANFAAIQRHRATVEAIEGDTVTLSSGARLQPDLLLWGTGYRTDLSWLDVPALQAVRTADELAARCGGVFRSLDADDLYLPAVVLDGIGTSTWSYALMARTLMSHIRGTARLDLEPVRERLVHFAALEYLAPRDPANFGADWRREWTQLALNTPDDQPYPLP